MKSILYAKVGHIQMKLLHAYQEGDPQGSH